MRRFMRARSGMWVANAVVALGAATLVAGCGGSGGGGGGGFASTAAPVSSGQATDLVALEVSPPGDLVLDDAVGSAFQVIVDGYLRDASVRDLTRDVTLTSSDEGVVRVGGDGLITAIAPGTADVSVSVTSSTGETLTVTKQVTVVAASGAQPVFRSLDVYPQFRTLGDVDAAAGVDQLQQIVVVGTDDTGRQHDLTRVLGVQVSTMQRAPSMAGQLSPTGLFRGVVDGEEVLLIARLDSAGLVSGSHLVLGSGAARPVPPSALYSGAPLAGSTNPIDVAVLSALRAQFIEPAKLATDEEFQRRLHADALGRLPTAAEVEAFAASPDREAEIDRVLALPAFATRWGTLFGEWFEIRRANAAAFDAWAAGEIAADAPLADMVAALARGQGAGGQVFDQQHATAAEKVDVLVLAATGMTAKCAQCHDHPLAGPNDTPRWTQDDRFPLDAFFAATPVEATKLDRNSARVGQPYQPGFEAFAPGTAVTSTLQTPIAQRRDEFATLFAATSQLRRGLAHRMFAEVVTPLLDPNQFLKKNLDQVAVPQVLDALTQAFDAAGTRPRTFLRQLFASRTYQLSAEGADTTNDPLLARHVLRRNHCEVAESLVEGVTGAAVTGNDLTFFRQAFGFPAERISIEERSTAVNMSQALLLMNSPIVQAKVAANAGTVAQLATQVGAGTLTQAQAVTRLFQLALARSPSSDELGFATDTIAQATNVRQGLEDVAAVLMSTVEAAAR